MGRIFSIEITRVRQIEFIVIAVRENFGVKA